MNVFVLDNFDSFTYNLVHILEQISDSVIVKRNNQVNINELVNFDKIVFSPGPGIPSDVQIMFDILDKYKETKSILGVCLGHQAIA
ncbi:MAG: aminodeoxychorismate/anthranilate synthase component II, partial [Bacteroidales bacterium]|nr:aminodeoxychorismate/anthranilate synthase component II [Bacteroidales bacterium]